MNHPLPQTPDIAANWEVLRSDILRVCQRSGRSADEITVVAVTKTQPVDIMRKAYAVGIRHFGENRIQETIEKYGSSLDSPELQGAYLHLIGHLQRNKVRKAVQVFDSVDSIDDVELARTVDLEAGKQGKRLRVLLEVNTSNEPQKFGVSPDSLMHLAGMVMGCRNLQLVGLMTVGPNVTEQAAIRQSFRLLKQLFEQVADRLHPENWSVLSMGMSGDYEVAIEEGATELRLGTVLFGQRREA